MDKVSFGYEEVEPTEKTRRVRGVFSSVSVITCSTCVSVIRRGAPGRAGQPGEGSGRQPGAPDRGALARQSRAEASRLNPPARMQRGDAAGEISVANVTETGGFHQRRKLFLIGEF